MAQYEGAKDTEISKGTTWQQFLYQYSLEKAWLTETSHCKYFSTIQLKLTTVLKFCARWTGEGKLVRYQLICNHVLLCTFAFKWNYLQYSNYMNRFVLSPQRTWNDTIRRIRLMCKSVLYISITICVLFPHLFAFFIPASPYFIKRLLF